MKKQDEPMIMYTQYFFIASLKGEVKALVILFGSSVTAKALKLKRLIDIIRIIGRDFFNKNITNN